MPGQDERREVGAGKTENTFIIILEVMGVRVSVNTGQGKKYILENRKSYHSPFSDRHLSPSKISAPEEWLRGGHWTDLEQSEFCPCPWK